MKRSASLVFVAALLAATGALAEPPKAHGQREALKRFCSADFTVRCPNANPDSEEAEVCIRQHMKELSPGCQDAIAKEEGKTAKTGAAAK